MISIPAAANYQLQLVDDTSSFSNDALNMKVDKFENEPKTNLSSIICSLSEDQLNKARINLSKEITYLNPQSKENIELVLFTKYDYKNNICKEIIFVIAHCYSRPTWHTCDD